MSKRNLCQNRSTGGGAPRAPPRRRTDRPASNTRSASWTRKRLAFVDPGNASSTSRSLPIGASCSSPAARTRRTWARRVHPFGNGARGDFARAGRGEALRLGQEQGQLRLGNGDGSVALAVHEGDGLTPIPLPREDPVAELVIDGLFADALALDPLEDPELRFVRSHSAELAGVDRVAVLDVAGLGLLGEVGARFELRLGGHDLDDG